ncbi:hypothetical protein ACVXHM_17035 [Pseudomonas aeruginosa]|jgi:hypothetical protein|uniref:Uncharacterized protein n=3 Tax=Pseudomonas TaxID=286 RepID=A0AAQ3LJ85_PSEAI|nr:MULTISPECIES: hypothetical protein [Pseudomonas]EPL60812.1 hypothetical protein B382_19755 [Stutzerimonas stutzeri B1SMN1]MBP7824375.1 hypothetical protein [Pseudomonas sp.]OWG36413.1 hypothetical protein CAQ69_21285 [Stutzerimonas stutzeri]OZB32941.1 MAG: hypothetical protein B7X51_04935 [Pseudomonas sp. 34-62-33]EIU4790660.1 hypothetical protein [Pseudomonas aeruginosa]
MALSAVQQALVDAAFPECRSDMAAYLEKATDVVIIRQRECGDDVPPFAIVAKGSDFWIDCADTAVAATSRARELGLNVVPA